MEQILIAKKNHYKNIRGKKKVKVLTCGNKYLPLTPRQSVKVIVEDDTNKTREYKTNLFFTISNSRQNKLNQIGI